MRDANLPWSRQVMGALRRLLNPSWPLETEICMLPAPPWFEAARKEIGTLLIQALLHIRHEADRGLAGPISVFPSATVRAAVPIGMQTKIVAAVQPQRKL